MSISLIRSPSGPERSFSHQLLLLLASAAINPYLCIMVFGQSVALAIKLFFYDKATGKKGLFGYLAVSVASILLTWYLIGLIDFKKRGRAGGGWRVRFVQPESEFAL
jgi:hypothetical protein